MNSPTMTAISQRSPAVSWCFPGNGVSYNESETSGRGGKPESRLSLRSRLSGDVLLSGPLQAARL